MSWSRQLPSIDACVKSIESLGFEVLDVLDSECVTYTPLQSWEMLKVGTGFPLPVRLLLLKIDYGLFREVFFVQARCWQDGDGFTRSDWKRLKDLEVLGMLP